MHHLMHFFLFFSIISLVHFEKLWRKSGQLQRAAEETGDTAAGISTQAFTPVALLSVILWVLVTPGPTEFVVQVPVYASIYDQNDLFEDSEYFSL